VLRQLELLVMRAPPELRCVLATRHDMRLGLHRLRLEGELTEIRAANLRFTLDEARALFGAAGVELPESALTLLHARTEGWAAGLRLAALSLAGHPDPERFAAEFSGSERTVAEYLLAEVLGRQSEEVRRLLVRTSILERVSGELADLLTGGSGAERILQDLEEAGAFVVSLDGRRRRDAGRTAAQPGRRPASADADQPRHREVWAFRFKDANQHLEQGVALAHRIRRPYLEFIGLAHGAELAALRSYTRGAQRSRQAIELAQQHGWSDEPFVAVAYTVLGGAMVSQGRLAEAERWLGHAARILQPAVEPAVGMHLHYARGGLEMARGRHADAIAAFRAARQLTETLVTPHTLATSMQAHMLQALVLLGATRQVEPSVAELDAHEREGGEMRNVIALLRLAQHDPQGATAALAPVLDGSVRTHPVWVVAAALLEAIARDELGDSAAAGRAVERALDLAEPDLVLFPFLIHPVPALLERHARDCAKHAALAAEILSLLPERPGGYGGMASPEARSGLGGSSPRLTEPSRQLAMPLSQGESRVLRYLPTNLSAPEIARELSVSVHTVRTHIRHVCGKLDAHGRTEAVTQARALGLLAPSPHAP
jgi:LuxR family maltose regulon positive regulatory protein